MLSDMASKGAEPQALGYRPFTNGLRSPMVAPITRFLLGVPLVFLTTRTDRFFAWTIGVPLTAAILGSNYFASAFLAVVASRRRLWAHGRISVTVALVFAPITTAATFIHIDLFHTDTFFGWFWIAAYGIYPPMLLYLLWRQMRENGADPPRESPLPVWVKAVFAAQALVLVPMGLVMFFAPGVAQPLFPWSLTDLTSRVLAAWCLALGAAAVQAIWENDFERVSVALATYPILALLHVVSLIRFGDDVQWREPGAWIYLGLVATWCVLPAWGYLERRRRASTERPVPLPERAAG
jgi:hypothetical protein